MHRVSSPLEEAPDRAAVRASRRLRSTYTFTASPRTPGFLDSWRETIKALEEANDPSHTRPLWL